MKNELSKQIALFDDSKRAVANLMARENISVQIVDGAPTASFDPITRVLTIPAWNSLTVDQIDMLMAHEIGHALFSDNTIYEKIAKDKKSLFSYVNVVEDARIERKMKSSFPGLARTFYNGYREFHTDGPIFKGDVEHLFNPKTGEPKLIADMKLIDRINLYYKIGAFCRVSFSPEERVWIDRIDRCGSMDQAIAIARDLHKLAKETEKPEPKPEKNENPSNEKNKSKVQDGEQAEGDDAQAGNDTDGDDQSGDDEPKDESGDDESDSAKSAGDDESDDQDGDDQSGDDQSGDDKSEGEGDDIGDEQDEAGSESGDAEGDDDSTTDGGDQGTKGGSGAGEDADVSEAETVSDMEEALKKMAEQTNPTGQVQVRHLLISPVSDEIFANRTVSAKDWADMSHEAYGKLTWAYAPVLDQLEAAWDERFMSTAAHMALEFERRKTAKNLQNARIGKTGKLNLAKLSQYRFTEDLFLRSMNVPNGKSHGIVMVIDASGSMSGCFGHVMDQVLLFAHFAQKVNIPFEAYMFTTSNKSYYEYDDSGLTAHDAGLHQISLSDGGRLVGLVNTKSSRPDFKRQIRTVLVMRQQYAHDVNLRAEAYELMTATPFSSLGGTPLFTGVMLGEKALGTMKRVNRLDKTTFVVVTDGMDGNGLQYRTNTADRYSGRIGSRMERVGATAIVVRDTVTKRNFTYATEGTDTYTGRKSAALPTNAILTMLLDVIKARHDARTVYLYLQAGRMTEGYARGRRRWNRPEAPVTVEGFNYLVRAGKFGDAKNIQHTDVVAALTADGQYVLPKDLGVADLAIILRTNTLCLTEDEFAKMDTTDMTQRKVAAQFTKSMVKSVANRVFVNTVIPHLI